MAQRAADRLGETLDVLIEEPVPAGESGEGGTFTGRAAHQAPEVDGVTTVRSAVPLAPGDMVRAVVTGSDGVDLVADAIVPAGAMPPGRR
jgi:ribosomal protein S12 methylthiotransferase